MPELESAGGESKNFAFLREHEPLLLRLCIAAEQYFWTDPNTSLLKLRQFGEALARNIAAIFGIDARPDDNQAELLGLLQRQGHLDRDVASLFHVLRKVGNDAAHRFETTPGQAREALKVARTAAIWFHRSFGRTPGQFKPGGFQEPIKPTYAAQAPAPPLTTLDTDLQLRLASETARREAAEHRATLLASDSALWQQLAQEEERQRLALQAQFDTELQQLIDRSTARTPMQAGELALQVQIATKALAPDEEETRALIDAQLRTAGWEVDSHTLRHGLGARPEVGHNKAIAEWPTDSGPADYVLFAGLVAAEQCMTHKLPARSWRHPGMIQ